MPHHGSETASTQRFIDAVNPEWVVVSASTRHSLPRASVVARYDPDRRVVLRTDRRHESDNDHVVCGRDENGAFLCNYGDVLVD